MAVMTKVFVTGGAGYIGSHTCKQLAAEGCEIAVYDNLSRGHREFVKWGSFIEGDLSDRGKLSLALQRFKPDAVFHFAAHAYVGESLERPELYYGNNVGGIVSVLSAMRDAAVERLVISSSCTVYGEPQRMQVTEEMPLEPISPYGRSKWMTEQICRDFDRAYGIRTVALRYFNAAGADLDGEIGERHEPETHLVPRVLMAADGGTLEVYGDDHATPDGTCIRDFVHVADLADAHMRAAEYLMDGGPSEEFNVGSGIGRSVREIIAMAERVTGVRVTYNVQPKRRGDPAILVASVAKVKRVINWSPRHSDLKTIVDSAWAWHLKEKNRAQAQR
jgi:UDP-glucose-4-epimerase GalE